MEKSESIKQIAVALIAAQGEMGPAIKSKVHPVFKGSYENINDVLEACLPVLNKHGLAPLQPVVMVEGFSFIETTIIHTSGEYLGGSLYPIVSAKTNDPQAQGSAVTYAKRYALKSFLSIRTEDDDDDDGQKAMPSATTKEAPKEPAKTEVKQTQEDKDLAAIVDAANVDVLAGFKKDWPKERWTKKLVAAAAHIASTLKAKVESASDGSVAKPVEDKVKKDMDEMAQGTTKEEIKKLPAGVEDKYSTQVGHGIKKVEEPEDELAGL